MAKTKEQKEKILKGLQVRLSKMKSLVFSNYYGLTVGEMEELRKLLKEKGGEYFVTKKTLLKLALKDSSIEGVDLKKIVGGMGLAFGFEDEIIPAKILADFRKKHKALEINGGILENSFIDKEKILEIAKLPTRDELIARTVGSIRAPLFKLINVLEGNLRGLVNVLKAVREAK